MAEFPKLAAEVTASLLGLYLASVSIVVGTVYQDVSADIRSLVLGGETTRRRLRLTGTTLGAALFLVLLESLSVPFGTISLVGFALLLAFSALAFTKLAFGSLNLLDPLALVSEPLSQLARSLSRLDRLEEAHDALRRREARSIQRQLQLLSQIVRLSQKRAAISTSRLTALARHVANALIIYSYECYRIPTDSGWHLPAATYPRWVESDNSSTDLAIRTGIPLQGKEEPDTFWLETALGGLMAEVLAATVEAADQDAALMVLSVTASSVRQVAALRYPDAADAYWRPLTVVCWDVGTNPDNAAARAVQGEPPTLLMSSLLGWSQGIEGWPQEIRDNSSDNSPGANVGAMHGPRRVLRAVSTLRKQIEAEIQIDGRRASPSWFIRMALADSAILAIREYACDLPAAVRDNCSLSGPANQPPTNVVALCTQSVQLAEKALLTLTRMTAMLPSLEELRSGNPAIETPEIDAARVEIVAIRKRVIRQLADQLPHLEPSRNQAEPDWFGDAYYRCLHETADAIAMGDSPTVEALFPLVMSASLRLDGYVRTVYIAPTYQVNSAVLDPLMDLFEISGLALIYGEVRQDESARTVVDTWNRFLTTYPDTQKLARDYLDLLYLSRWGFGPGISPRSVSRSAWEIRLSKDIVARGLARPRYSPFGDRDEWQAPKIAKLLGVSEDYPDVSIEPRVLFAARILAPASGESEVELRKRPELRRYYEKVDFVTRDASRGSPASDESEVEDSEDV